MHSFKCYSDNEYSSGACNEEADDEEDLALEVEALTEDASEKANSDVFAAFQYPSPAVCHYHFIPSIPHTSWYRPKLSRAARFFQDIVHPASFIHAQSLTILGHCFRLRSLTYPGLHLGYHNMFAFGGLSELTVHDVPNDLTSDGIVCGDYSRLTRLRLLGAYMPLRGSLAIYAPNITHLHIRRNTFTTTLDTLTRLQHLTHLWLTPTPSTPPHGTETKIALPAFLHGLHELCLALVHVRIDAGPDEDLDVDVAMFPFVHVHRYGRPDPSWSTTDMWVNTPIQKDNTFEDADGVDSGDDSEQNTNFMDDAVESSESSSESCSEMDNSWDVTWGMKEKPMTYNVYTNRLREYWSLRYSGGGWDD